MSLKFSRQLITWYFELIDEKAMFVKTNNSTLTDNRTYNVFYAFLLRFWMLKYLLDW